ncbi:MAG: type 1 glutamine amidotransferase [bacterium]
MRFSIFQAGRANPATRRRKGDYGRMMIDLLSGDGETWHVHDVEHGRFPDDLAEYDGFVITGSRHSVGDPLPWIRRLMDCVRRIRDRGQPLIGICFGHQLVAEALGGRVARNALGWEIGVRAVRLTDQAKALPELRAAPDPVRILEFHQDAVTRLPPDAVPLGRGEKTAYEMFSVGPFILCLQGHPEFDSQVVREGIEALCAAGRLDAKQAGASLDTLAQAEDRDFLRGLLRGFLTNRGLL